MPTTLDKNPKNEHIMSDKLSRSLYLKYKNIVQVDNANLKEDNNNNLNNNTGAEQPLTIDVRLERRPEKTCHKKPLGEKKQEIWVGTMAQAPALGSLSYGGFTKVRQPIVQ